MITQTFILYGAAFYAIRLEKKIIHSFEVLTSMFLGHHKNHITVGCCFHVVMNLELFALNCIEQKKLKQKSALLSACRINSKRILAFGDLIRGFTY